MNINQIYDELSLQIDKNRMILDAAMKEYTSFRAGGNAALLVQPQTMEELAYLLKLLTEHEVKHLVIGNGSNLLVKDAGYQGVIIRTCDAFQQISVIDDRMEVGAGVLLSTAAREACNASLTGFEFAAGIPGSIGGAVFMNAGAYDGEVSNIIESAEVLSKDGAKVISLKKEELELSYRHSILQRTGDILLRATFRLEKGDPEKIIARMKELTLRRTEKQPLTYPSAGSFFKRPHNNFAGKLIQDAGLGGLQLGGAQISPLHAGFIINTGSATATDIIDLMEIVRSTVYQEFGILLEPEVRIIGD